MTISRRTPPSSPIRIQPVTSLSPLQQSPAADDNHNCLQLPSPPPRRRRRIQRRSNVNETRRTTGLLLLLCLGVALEVLVLLAYRRQPQQPQQQPPQQGDATTNTRRRNTRAKVESRPALLRNGKDRIVPESSPTQTTTRGGSAKSHKKSHKKSSDTKKNAIVPLPTLEATKDAPKTQTNKQRSTSCPVNHCLALGLTAREQYPNRIIFESTGSSVNRAGLMDRIIRLQHLMNLGAMLCATVELPSPRQLLQPKHNGQELVSEHMTWDDLAVFHFWGDDEDEGNRNITASTMFKTTSRRLSNLDEHQDSQGVYFPRKLHSPMVLQQGERTHDRKHDSTTTPTTTTAQETVHHFYNSANGTHYLQDMYNILQQRKEHTLQQDASLPRESFEWIIRPDRFWDFLRWDVQSQLQQMLRHEREEQSVVAVVHKKKGKAQRSAMIPAFTQPNLTGWTCGSYVRYRYPPKLISLAQQVLREAVKMAYGRNDVWNSKTYSIPFGFFHVRRTDTIQSCDTSLQRMKRFLNCSLNGPLTQAMGQEQPFPLLVFLATDEQDPSYRQGILKLLGTQQQRPTSGLQIHAMDLDPLIRSVLRRRVVQGTIPDWYLNNYVVFWIGKILSRKSWFLLSQRKARFCEDCARDTVEGAFQNLKRQQREQDVESIWQLPDQEGWGDLEFRDE